MINATIFAGIFTKLNTDPTLMALFGTTVGAKPVPCFRGQRILPAQAPCCTIREMPGKGTLRPGSDANWTQLNAMITEETAKIQVNTWVSSEHGVPQNVDDADAIDYRIDYLLRRYSPGWVTYTHSWEVISGAQQYEDETKLWHNTRTYTFDWHLFNGGSGTEVLLE